MNGITYFRLESDYDGDYTKKCGLTGQEIDNNFYVLEGRDVKSLEVDGDDITIVLYNGNRITAEDALSGYAKDLSFDFDKESGTLTIKEGDTVLQTITGFSCDECGTIYTDQTIVGDGTKDNPLGVSPMQQTGHYKPVKDFIDLTKDGEKIPEPERKGDRYIVKNEISNYGRLYNYCAVRHIQNCILAPGDDPYKWRIPTRSDWNEMLNALEGDGGTPNHNAVNSAGYPYSGVFLGKYAGKFLKSDCGWDTCESGADDDCQCSQQAENGCGGNMNPCMPTDCHHQQITPTGIADEGTEPYDCYNIGFNAMPLGYYPTTPNDESVSGGILTGKRAYFWTQCNSENEAFAKILDYCHNDVRQEIFSKENYMSIRLVKDRNPENYTAQEEIHGQVFETSIVPYVKENGEKGSRIWTTSNVGFDDITCGDSIPASLDGTDCEESTTVYSIIEWNGANWVYQKIGEGETVTVLCPENEENCEYTDYMLVNGELVPKGQSYDSDIEELNEKIKGIIDDMSSISGRVLTIEDTIGDYNTEKGTIADRLDETDSIIGDYANEKTISERLDEIEATLAELAKNHDFGDIDNDGLHPEEDIDGGDEIIVNGELW